MVELGIIRSYAVERSVNPPKLELRYGTWNKAVGSESKVLLEDRAINTV